MQWAHQKGYRVHTWTVDDTRAMERLIRAGTDLIITNRPDLLHQVLHNVHGEQSPAPLRRLPGRALGSLRTGGPA